MVSFQEFLNQLGTLKNQEIPFFFRNQFKIRENFINPNSKHFDAITQKLLLEEKSGIKRKWDKQCKMLFIWIIVKFFQLRNKRTINPNVEEWDQLSKILNIEEVTLKQRWITLINPLSKSINWDQEEDEIIKSLMKEQEEKHIWTTIALELYNKNNGQFVRTPKQVRERWMNYLNPKLRKSNWSFQEDLQLLSQVVKHGKRWSLISSLLEGRTENQVKNRFKSLIHKIYKEEDDDDIEELQAIKDYLKKFNTTDIPEPVVEEQNQQQAELIQQQQQLGLIQQQQKSNQEQKQEQQEKLIEPKLNRKIYKRKVKKQKKVELQQQQQYEQPAFIKEEDKSQIENVDLNLQQLQHQMQHQQQIQYQQQQQFCLSLQGTCDTKSQENRKDLSTPISLASFYPQFNDEMKNEQLKQFLNQTNRQNPVVSPLYQNSYPQLNSNGFRPFQPDSYYDLMQQQTPLQLNRLYMEQCMKNSMNNMYFNTQNIVSPFPNSSTLGFNQMYYFTPTYLTQSPSILRSPFTEGSPSLKQYSNWIQQLQSQELAQQQQDQQFSGKLEFLNKPNIIDVWKHKRDAQKQVQKSEV